MTVRPRRSLLFMPASNARVLEKAKTLACDGVIFDLEDAVSPDTKELAREQACAAVKTGGYGTREIAVRVNGMDTPWFEEDLKAVVAAKPDAVVIPKVENGDMVRDVAAKCAEMGEPDMAIWANMETPRAFLNALDITDSHSSLACILMGSNDLVKELHAHHTEDRAPIMTALSIGVMAGRASGLDVIDAVYNDIRNVDGFEAQCFQALSMGFDGKALIHPGQIEAANRIFSPSSQQLEHAQNMIDAFEAAVAEGKSMAVLNGKMIEELHLVEAKRLISLSKLINN